MNKLETLQALVKKLRGQVPDSAAMANKVDDIPMSTVTSEVLETPAPKIMSKAEAPSLAQTADELQGSVDDALKPRSLAKPALATTGIAGLSSLALMGDGEQQVQAATPGINPNAKKSEAPAIKKQIEPVKNPDNKSDSGQKTKAAQVQETTEVKANNPDYMDLLKEAQEADRHQDRMNRLRIAGERIGSGLAKTPVDQQYIKDTANYNVGKNVANLKDQMSTQKVQTELNDETKLRDPASDVSTAFRQALAKLGIKHSDQTTAADAKAMGINIQNLLMHEKTIDAQMRKTDKMANDKTKAFKLAAYKTLQRPFGDYQKVATAYDSVAGLNDLASDPNGAKDIYTLYNFIKGLDPNSSVKEGEIALSQQGISLLEQAGIKAKKLNSGQILSPQFRTQITEVLKMQKEAAEKDYDAKAAPVLLQGADYGLGEADFGDIDPMSAARAKAKAANPAGGQFPMQVRKNGKVATVQNEQELAEAKAEGWN
jgi:hypothetical protein